MSILDVTEDDYDNDNNGIINENDHMEEPDPIQMSEENNLSEDYCHPPEGDFIILNVKKNTILFALFIS